MQLDSSLFPKWFQWTKRQALWETQWGQCMVLTQPSDSFWSMFSPRATKPAGDMSSSIDILSSNVHMLQHNSGVWAEQSLEPLLLQLWLLHNKVDIFIIYWNLDSQKLTMFSGTRPLASWRHGRRIWKILPGTLAIICYVPQCSYPVSPLLDWQGSHYQRQSWSGGVTSEQCAGHIHRY